MVEDGGSLDWLEHTLFYIGSIAKPQIILENKSRTD